MAESSHAEFPRIPKRANTGGVKRPRPKTESPQPRPGLVCDLAATPKPIAISQQHKGADSKDDPLHKRFAEWFEKSDISHESKDYVWKLFVHIQNQNKQLKHYIAELQKLKSERASARKEVLQWKSELDQRKNEAEELSLQCKKFAETRSSDIEKLKKHMMELTRKLEIERVCNSNLRKELKEWKRARSGGVKDVTTHRKREQLLEHQVTQMRILLAHRNQERVLKSSQILNEYNKIKRNYDQALRMIHQLKISIAQATVATSKAAPS